MTDENQQNGNKRDPQNVAQAKYEKWREVHRNRIPKIPIGKDGDR